MKILLLTQAFNSLAQRLHVELTARGHTVSVEFDVNDAVTREAVAAFAPELVLAPFLRRAIPDDVWRATPCFIVHPGPVGDAGPSALDWAIQEGRSDWGVTVLQAEAEFDTGPVWAAETFAMRAATKSSIYRREVTDAAVRAVATALDRFASGTFVPQRPAHTRARPLMRQADRAIDWSRDDTAAVLRKIRAADGQPGVLDDIDGMPVYLYDATPAAPSRRGAPGASIGHANGAICRATIDGAVWIGRLRPASSATGERTFKLPAEQVLHGSSPDGPPGPPAAPPIADAPSPIRYWRSGRVGYLEFAFYNGAMSTHDCERLRAAIVHALRQPTAVLCLLGGEEFWANGIDLNAIEAAASPADESWRTINAIDDVVRELVAATHMVTVSVLRGNAGAGGVFVALAADRVVARDGIVLNPHYRNMGNLYGSEYWTYLLPRRMGREAGEQLMRRRLPIGAAQALEVGLVDRILSADAFDTELQSLTDRLLADASALIETKTRRRADDEAMRPLDDYRRDELDRMRLNFYGFDPSYHIARYYFVRKQRPSRTPLYLARHR